jgi:hypothetical protein
MGISPHIKSRGEEKQEKKHQVKNIEPVGGLLKQLIRG